MKLKVLHTIYEVFEDWSQNLPAACSRGCSSCCTQNVTITAIEGEEILRYVLAEGMSPWFAAALQNSRQHLPAKITTNDFAGACLDGRETHGDTPHALSPCPFLKDQLCRIYPVRPFGCRLFSSTQRCSPTQPAILPDFYFEAATAVTQLVEHLGQKEYWGNMLDVLPALLDISEFQEIASQLQTPMIIKARLQTLTAQPLPGFLLSEENGDKVASLLETIFKAEVDGKQVEDILNGR